jgi:hypothetical protein
VVKVKKREGIGGIFLVSGELLVCFNSLLNHCFCLMPAGHLYCTDATFDSFKKYATHFLNPDCVGTEPKEASYAVVGRFLRRPKFVVVDFIKMQ